MNTPVVIRNRHANAPFPLLLITSLLIGAFNTGVTKAAAIQDDRARVVVRYTDFDLATDIGVQRLYRRLTSAAIQVCPQQSGSPFVNGEARRCREQAVTRAVLQIDNPRLARVLAANGKPE